MRLFTTLDVDEEKHDTHEYTYAPDDHVSDAEERIFAAEDRRRRQDDFFRAGELRDFISVINQEMVCAFGQSFIEWRSCMIDFAIKFAKTWQSGRSHPNDQIFVLKSVVVFVVRI